MHYGESGLHEFTIAKLLTEHHNAGLDPRQAPLWNGLRKLYILADKWCYEELSNKLSDIYRQATSVMSQKGSTIDALDERLPDGIISNMWCTKMAWYLKRWGFENNHAIYDETEFLDWCCESVHLGAKVIGLLVSKHIEHPMFGGPCKYHWHRYTPMCTSNGLPATVVSANHTVGTSLNQPMRN